MKNTNIRIVLIIIYLSLLFPNIFSFLLVLSSSCQSYFGTYYSYVYIGLYLLIIAGVIYLSCFFIDCDKKIIYVDIRSFVNVKVLFVLMSLLIVGIFLHLYDKVSIRGYNYFSDSIRSIREQWLNDGIKRNGTISSWQSAFGYLFSFMYFAVMHLVIVVNLKLRQRWKYIIVFISTLSIIILSYTIGSRSIILFSIVFILALYILLFIYNRYSENIKLLIPMIVVFVFYIILVTYMQIYGNNKNINFNAYISGYNKELMVKTNIIKQKNNKIKNNKIKNNKIKNNKIKNNKIKNNKIKNNKIKNILSLIILYANHGIYNFEYTLYQKEHPGIVTFSSVISILRKFNIIDIKQSNFRTYGKGMISAFGAIWYDFGIIGFVIFSLFHAGLFILVAIGLTNKNSLINMCSQFGFIFFIILNIFSPLTLATNLIIAPGFILSYIILFLIIYVNMKVINLKQG